MKTIRATGSINPGSPADRRLLINGLTLVALGLSVLFLNSWNNLFVRASVGSFWGLFFLILNWSELVSALRVLRQRNHSRRRASERSSTQA